MSEVWNNHKKQIIAGCLGLLFIFVVACGAISFFTGRFALRSAATFLDERPETNISQPSKPDFYESTGGWDFVRIPLIEPYQAKGVNGSWEIKLKESSISFNRIGPLTRIFVIDQVILAEAQDGHIHARNIEGPVWYVIVPDQKIEIQFEDKEEFETYLSSLGITSYELHDVVEVHREFVDRGRLDWFP